MIFQIRLNVISKIIHVVISIFKRTILSKPKCFIEEYIFIFYLKGIICSQTCLKCISDAKGTMASTVMVFI